MGGRKRRVRRAIAWVLLFVMGIQCFGSAVPASTVRATDYEKASEEAEEQIRAAEEAAGIGVPETEESGMAEEELSGGDNAEPLNEEPLNEEPDNAAGMDDEPVLYEDRTISSQTTLTEDIEVGNLLVNSALHLNGHRLVVHGDMTLNAGLFVEEGYLHVEGSFIGQYRSSITMNTPNDYIEVDGDYVYNENYDDNRTVKAGTLAVGGNIYGNNGVNYCRKSVVFDSACKVILNGDRPQTVDIRTDSLFQIRSLTIENTSEEGVFSNCMLNCDSITDEGHKLHYPAEGEFGELLTEDKTVEGDYCLLGGTLDLAGHHLTVQGDFIHAGGKLLLNGGSLTIEGSYRKQFCYTENGEEVIGYSTGRLIMQNEQDYVLINGDYIDSGWVTTEGDLTAGVLELKGSMTGEDKLGHPLFYAKQDHMVRLTGNGQQIIHKGASDSGTTVRFAGLSIEQGESGSTVFDSTVVVTTSVEHLSDKITGMTWLVGAQIKSVDLYGDIKIEDNYTFSADVTIHGNLSMGYSYYYGRNVYVNHCHVTVTGSFYHNNINYSFTGEQAMLTVLGDYNLEYGSGNSINSGTLQIGGDLKKDRDAYLSCGQGAEVHFIGKDVQTVSISHNNALLTNVVVDNPEGVVVEDNIAVINVSCKQGVLSYASGGVHGFTVEEDGMYEGDLTIGGGILDLNGHSYQVKGNLTIANGALNMTNPGDYLTVDGDFATASSVNHSGRLTEGTLELKGSFAQKGNAGAFAASGNHTVIFSGEDGQEVSFANSSASCFNNMEIRSAVKFATNVKAVGLVRQEGTVDGTLDINAATSFAGNSYQGNVRIVGEIVLSESLRIDGQLLIGSSLNLHGQELEVTGEVVCDDYYANLSFSHGLLSCGSLDMRNISRIYLRYADDRLTVQNDLNIRIWGGSIEAGKITVGGNVTLAKNSFSVNENIILEMSADKPQTITMSGSSSFGTLVLNNTSAEGIDIADELNYKRLVNDTGTKVTFSDGGILGYTLNRDEVIDGDLRLSGGELDLNGHSLTVQGDFVQSGGTLRVNKGTLVVDGDYCLAKRTAKEDGTFAYANTSGRVYMGDAEDRVVVKGDMHTAASAGSNWFCSAGTWQLSGNLTLWNNTHLEFQKGVMLILDGDKQQKLTFWDDRMRLGGLSVENDKGIAFPVGDHARIRGDLYTNGYPVEGWLDICSSAEIKDDFVRSNIRFNENYSLHRDLQVEGEVKLYRLTLNGYHLTVGGDCELNYSYNGIIDQKDGILEIKGDLLYSKYYYSYHGSGTNKVILSGDKKQTIQANELSWGFAELVIENTSAEGVYAAGLFDAERITDENHKLSFYTEGNTGYTLTKDTVIQGDFQLLAGTMDLNGHTLTVTGSLMQRGGTVEVNSGRLEVYGDYTLGNPNASGYYEASHAAIHMDGEEDEVFCGGDMVLAPALSLDGYLERGTIEIKGSFSYIASYYLTMGKELVLRFTGEQKQEILRQNYAVCLGTVSLENTSAEGVVVKSDLEITRPVKGNGKLTGTEGKRLFWNNGESFPFTQWKGNLTVRSDTVLAKDLVVDGTLVLDSSLDLNGKHLTVDTLDSNSTLKINGGILQVRKDFVQDNYNGKLLMQQDKDIVQITGSLDAVSGSMNLSAGSMEVKGNLNVSGVSLSAGDRHKMTLSGKMTARGTAYIQTVTVQTGRTFNTLVLTKPRSYYVFNRDVEEMCAELIEDIQDITAPSVPGGLSAENISHTSLKLTWNASSDDTAVAGYDVYRDEKKVMSVSGTSYTDKNLAPGTTYRYYVIAKDATLNTSAASKTYTVTTPEDEEAPGTPEKPELAERMATALRLNWNAVSDNVKVAGYRIYRNGEEIGTTARTEYFDTGLSVNEHYTYTISAYDSAGNVSELSEEADCYTQAVEVETMSPANFAKLSGAKPELTAAFLNAGSTSGYQVYIGYREPGGGDYTELLQKTVGSRTSYRKRLTASAYLETAGIAGEEIEVLVRITDAGGYEAEENYIYYLDKSAPAKLAETGVEIKDGVAVISYAKGTEADIAGYLIYREEEGKAREQIADIADPAKTYYYDKQITAGVTYAYYVAAYDEEGLTGELSDALVITCDDDISAPVIEGVEPAEGILSGVATLTVRARDNKALDSVVIEYYDEQEEDYVQLKQCPITAGSVDYALDTTGWQDEVTLRFTVYDAAGNENEDEFVRTYAVDNEGPEQIQNLQASITSTTAILTWDAPTDEDFSHFSLEEQQEDGTWREVAQTTEITGYALEGLLPDSTHIYRVTGYDIRNNAGAPSESVTVAIKEDTIAPRITSISPNGGYYRDKIPLVINGYDNIALAEMTVEYSVDRENWTPLTQFVFEEAKKEQRAAYSVDLTDIGEGDIYLRAYCKDTAGNEGDREQVLLQCIVDKTAPQTVDKLTAEGEGGSIHLLWNEPVDNDVAGYRIYRSPEGLNSYTCIADHVTTLGYYDRAAVYDTAYSYRISVLDKAGNESALSNVAVAQKLPDDVAPVVHSVIPEEDKWISGVTEISVLVSDNDRVSQVEIALREQGENGTKHTAGMVETNISSGTVSYELDTTDYANGVYELLVTARDAAGNSSTVFRSTCHISNVTLATPMLFASAGNWCTELHYSGMEDIRYALYKKNINDEAFETVAAGTGSLSYKDNEVNPSYTYVYQLMIQDKAGNTAKSVLSYVKPKPVDDQKPKAVILSDTAAVEGYEMVFNGLSSTDNNRIASYTWDFGDGTGGSQAPTPKHKYEKAGEYYVTLTVTDPAGNTGDNKIKITVLPKSQSGKAVVEVRNASGTPLQDVTVFVNTSTEHNDTSYTDRYGKAEVMQKPGTYRIALYKPGYVAVEKFVEIELHGEKEYVFTLEKGETVTADFTVHQMTFEEMVDAGIDLNDPNNQHVFTVKTNLTFMDATRPEGSDDIMIPAKAVVSGNSSIGGGGGSSGNGGGGGGGGGASSAAEEEEFRDMYYHTSVTQSISWLKDMYEATLIVYNNASSQTIVARNLETKLVVPYGMSLAGTYGGQSAVKKLDDIRGGESASATWYLRGDAPGKYKIQALMTGKLQPFNADLVCNFESNEFEVTAGEGLVLTIHPEDRAEKGEQYYVYFTLSNEGGKEFYNVKTTFGTQHSNSRRYAATADGAKRTPVMSAGDMVAVDCLKPGESISGIYRTMIPVQGEKWLNYKALIDYECEVLAGVNLGVAVRISPVASHVPVPDLTYQRQTDDNSEADPVNVSTGAYTDSINALSVQGVNPVSADLQYDSTATEELGEFGYGWSHNYEARILDMKDCTVRYYVSPTGYYTFLAEDSDKAEYKQDADGYYYLDEKSIPTKQSYKCLNENKAEYALKRNDSGTYTLTDAAGTTTKFDKDGNLTSIQNKDGKKLTFTRSEKQFTAADAVSGRKLTYTLNADKLVESVKDGNGREALFYYDENQCLKQFTNALGENTYYTYDKEHRILTVTDDDNNTYVTNTYKEYESITAPAKKAVRVESQKDGIGNKTTFSYHEDASSGDLVTTVTTRSGKKKKTVTDADGNITCQTNEAGDETQMTYDGDGNQTSISNANGYNTVYRYDGNGNMTAIENSLMDESRAETVMTYDEDGNLRTMKNVSGESMSCTYYDNGLIKSVTDQNENTVEYQYNEHGQVTEEKDADEKTITYEYNGKGDLIRVKDKNDSITEYSYNKAGLQNKVTVKDGAQVYTTQTFYDDLGRVSYTVDTEGGVTAYEYDCAGNVASRTDPGGAMTVYRYDDNGQMTKETVYTAEDGETVSSSTSYAYTKEGLLKKVTDGESGTVIENSYDAVGNKTKEVEKDKNGKKLSETLYEYDKAGNVIKQTEVNVSPKEGEPESRITQWKYYPNGKLNYQIDAYGVQTTYSYDKSWRVQTVTSDTEPAITYTYDPAGRVLTETVGGGSGELMTTSYAYDIHGNVTESTDPAGKKTLYRYDGNGNLLETEDCTGRVSYSRYDALNRVKETGVREPGKDESANIPLAYTAYDIKSHTVTETDAVNGGKLVTTYDSAGRPVRTANGAGAVLSETVYDTEGRILQTVDAKGMLTENVYNGFGQVEKVKTGKKQDGAPAGGLYAFTGEVRETAYAYDALGRNTQVTDAEQGTSTVVFDGLGRIASLKDPNQNAKGGEAAGNTYTYAYNAQGLLETEKNAVGNTTEYQYNSELLLKQMTDSAGEKTAYTYDSLNRLKTVKDGLGTIEYAYDANGNVTEVSEKEGGLSNLFAGKKVIRREFDSLNRITKYTDYKGREVKYAYDALGNMTALTYPGGEVVRYAYYADGSVAEMTSNSGGTFTYGYDNYGRLCRITRADGSVETRKYDPAGQLLSQTDLDKEGNVLQQHTYAYDVFGEVITKTSTNAQNPDVLETVSMTYDDANRLKTYNGESITYDEKGNMTYGPVDGVMQELTYDCRNRLVEAGGVRYTYDAENTRIATTENGLTTEYVTDTGGSLSRLLTAYEADNTETTYYYGADGLAAQHNSGTGKYFAYHYDNIGSTTLITAKDGHAVERFSYGTYGELLKGPITKIRFLYNGSYGVATDSNGLYYMRARYYNPDIKRFINQDIKVGDIGSSQSLNRYAYCEGNPVSMVDPFGLCGENANDQGQKSKYQWLHNALDWAGMVFDGADLVNGVLYAAEGDYVNAAISFACGIPAVGTVVAGVARATKAVKAIKTAQKITDACRTVAKVGNAAAGMKANYDTYMQARREGKSVGEAITYTAGAVVAGFAMGASAKWAAGKVRSLASRAMPKLKTAVKEVAGEFVSQLNKGLGISGSGHMKRNRGFVINPFYKGGSGFGKYQVGAYADIKGVLGLDAHHVGQKAIMKKLVANYDPKTAPAINVPKVGHTISGSNKIVSRNIKGITSARQLLARDLFELKRVYPDIPNSALKELIAMNKNMYPEMRK
ncbi:MAG: PKD domain-containing protein [Clostridium sp.]|nr:PKD domain-containing protein [Clostridium sp.]